MNIRLHIDRLILDGLNVDPGQGALVKASVEAELRRLLTEGEPCSDLQVRSTMSDIATNPMQIFQDSKPSSIGIEIAREIYGRIR